jgi:hypothetical protein
MTRPDRYKETYVLNTDTAYGNTDTAEEDPHAIKGSLQRGRVVWLQNDPPTHVSCTRVTAYAEGIGMVILNTTCLDRARLLRSRS